MTEALPARLSQRAEWRNVADLAWVAAAFGERLRTAGLPVGPDRCERFARAVTVLNPATLRQLRDCALATLVSDPDQLAAFDAAFAAVFGGLVDPASARGPGTAAAPAAG
ncbi:MAG TPA: hypothetical protein VGX25_05225, partial [Actinophytocola sp.]|nr:hypothetical protein [Actinophytocola sp.]